MIIRPPNIAPDIKQTAMHHSLLNPSTQLQLLIMKDIQAARVKDIVTKFFYQDNQLCFHILVRMENGETVLFGEFADYSAYKNCFTELQKAKAQGNTIKLPEKSILMDTIVTKVA